MKRIIAIAALLLAVANICAQDTSKVVIKPYGFVRNYFNYDSRRMVTVCGGEYLMIPSDEDWNATEEQALPYDADDLRFDRNAVPEAHLLALSTRFGLELHGPTVLGARSSGRVEGDFAGFGNNNTVLRLRLAYLNLDWERHSILVGQDWHPLSGSIMPEVLGMAAGAPFRPHSRTPQVRWTISPFRHWGVTASALWQYQYTSPGPDGESATYANRSLLPEMFVGLNYKVGATVYAQLGMDYTNLLVRSEIPMSDEFGNTLFNVLYERRCHSFSPTVYFQYTPGLFSLKLRSTLARNLAHLNMLSGYAWAARSVTDLTYIPTQASVSYLDLCYGKRWRANLFLGYQKNLGLADRDYAIVMHDPANLYMKKGIKNINSIFRLAPSVSYNTKVFNIGLEYEWTAVTYGDIKNDASVEPKRQVNGHRICALVKYNF